MKQGLPRRSRGYIAIHTLNPCYTWSPKIGNSVLMIYILVGYIGYGESQSTGSSTDIAIWVLRSGNSRLRDGPWIQLVSWSNFLPRSSVPSHAQALERGVSFTFYIQLSLPLYPIAPHPSYPTYSECCVCFVYLFLNADDTYVLNICALQG